MGINMDELYTCPDCGESAIGTDMPTFEQDGKVHCVCPHCGVIQEEAELQRQLGYKEEE